MAHIPDSDPGPLLARTDWFQAWYLLLRVGRGVKVQLLSQGEWVSIAPSGYIGIYMSLFPEFWNQLKTGPRSLHCPSFLVCCLFPSPSSRVAPGLCGIFVKLEKDAQCPVPRFLAGGMVRWLHFSARQLPPLGVPSVQLCLAALAIPSLCSIKAPKPAQGEQPAACLVEVPLLLLPPW